MELTAAWLRCLGAALLLVAVSCSSTDTFVLGAPNGTQSTLEGCSAAGADRYLSSIVTDGPIVQVFQTDQGAQWGARNWREFAVMTAVCISEVPGSRTQFLERYLKNLECELWVHNLVVAVANQPGRLGDTVRSSKVLRALAGRGRPVDMDLRVWAGELKGRPWDGKLGTCASLHQVLDTVLVES